jgi:hypothetical protein
MAVGPGTKARDAGSSASPAARSASRASRILEPRLFWFFVGVVVVQSVHMFEHVLQLIQVTVWNVPDDEALGLLGYVFQLQDTEEWLHLFFNLALLTSLWVLLGPVRAASPSIVPRWAYLVYVIGAVGLETWHEVEHLVIISRVLMNHGCPCPGIGDAALGVTDTVLHFIYNAVVTSAMLVPFWFVIRAHRRSRRLVRLETPAPRSPGSSRERRFGVRRT